MTCGTRLVALVWLAFAIGTVSCGSDTPQGNGGGAGSSGSAGGGNAGGSGDRSVPSRGPIADAGSGIVVVGGSGGAAGAAGAPAGTGGVAGTGGAVGGGAGSNGDGGPTLPICPDGVRGNDIACDSNVDVICIADCVNDSRIRCGCTSRGMGQGGDRWVCGGQPQDCQ